MELLPRRVFLRRNPPVVPLGTHKKQVELLRNAWWVTQKDANPPYILAGGNRADKE